ncbi:MAG TPA: hydroxymethylglutaryl-CoA lyase, partial [Polyangiaceae bacterium]|nr:hydroxymethylglutaryl-CoA lyase [Polyangiaceae bacterium]
KEGSMASETVLFASAPDAASIYEVSMRDGLQNEARTLPLGDKLALLDALLGSGLRRVELTSFVSPTWIPQLADADALAQAVGARSIPPGAVLSALCPNARGLARALAVGLREIAVFVSASETHNKKNVNRTIEESLAGFEAVVAPARAAGVAVRAYVSCVWGCPYEGDVDERAAAAIAKRLLALGCYQVSLGDTIGAGTPRQTARIVERFLGELPVDAVALHMHDTRGTALANVLAGLELGVRHFDASVGGLGGCPYAAGAAGNVATEDLVYLLEGMGVRTGLSLPALVEAAQVASRVVGRVLPGKVHRAGPLRREGAPNFAPESAASSSKATP